MEEKIELSNIKMRIFIPLSSCTCIYQQWMDRVFEEILPIKTDLDFDVEDSSGDLGYKYNIIQNTIMIEFKDKSKETLFLTKISELREFVNKIKKTKNPS